MPGESPATSPSGPSGRRLLLVEDDGPSARALSRLLRKRGWDVTAAAGVRAAIAALDDRPDVALLDLMLPDGDGEAVLRAIRDRALPCRAVVMTGVPAGDRLRRLADLAPDAVLEKPLDLDALLRTIE
jgi:CheY-like chemotaxis protein